LDFLSGLMLASMTFLTFGGMVFSKTSEFSGFWSRFDETISAEVYK
jgi:hypothetical protein